MTAPTERTSRVDRNNNDLSRYQFSCPAWWGAFMRGRRGERERAINDRADWRDSDFQREAVSRITEGVET